MALSLLGVPSIGGWGIQIIRAGYFHEQYDGVQHLEVQGNHKLVGNCPLIWPRSIVALDSSGVQYS